MGWGRGGGGEGVGHEVRAELGQPLRMVLMGDCGDSQQVPITTENFHQLLQVYKAEGEEKAPE